MENPRSAEVDLAALKTWPASAETPQRAEAVSAPDSQGPRPAALRRLVASRRPQRAGSIRVMPAATAAAAAGRKTPASGPPRAAWWRVPVFLGIGLASCLCIGSVIGINQAVKDYRNARKNNAALCLDVRDRITEWGKRQAVEAATLGSMMARERSLSISPSTPFLVPGLVSKRLQRDRLMHLAKEFQEMPPTVMWFTTLPFEDRVAFEQYAGKLYGAPGGINVTDLSGGNVDNFDDITPTYTPITAPARASYNPLAALWTVADPLTEAAIQRFIGVDMQEYYRRTLPPALEGRFEDMRPLAHPLYFGGVAMQDYVIVVLVKVVSQMCLDGFDGDGCDYHDGEYQPPISGYASFSLHADRWASIFPDNVGVRVALTSDVIKTPGPGYAHWQRQRPAATAHEPFLDLDLECYHRAERSLLLLYTAFALVSPIVVVLLLLLLRKLELGAARERRNGDERCRDAARDKALLEQRKGERIRYGFEMSEKTERYLNHELKNRIFVLGQSCADPFLHRQIDEITEVLSSKAVLMRLSTGRYKPSWDAVEPTALVDLRWRRHHTANSPFNRAKTTGAAAHRTKLRFDKVLFNIILDNMLSNAFKYGDARPPSLSLNVEPLNEGATRVRLSLELRNWAGPEHAALLQLGEEKLNEIAHAEGQRAHGHSAELSSGDGFPMAAAAASVLGGTVRLVLLEDGVLAKLELPDVLAVLPGSARFAAVLVAPVELDISWLKIALADDSAMFRKTFARLTEKVTSQEPFVAGATRESIDDFPKAVVERDCDVVLLDFNFAPTHHTKTGVDLCRECRQLDAEEGNVPRIIFIVSANDSPDDAERYRAAGADGSLGKKLTAATLRQALEDAVRTHPRFAARRDATANVVVATVSRQRLSAIDTPPPSPRLIGRL
ncbi:hypothetical protein M885DRAFT_620098 [Pelagophyceae sp. CCMP2097]|nr:hypothetical protein M885DRAFT_620098 [Pelagophyceae sp. CCMP2097]